MNIRLRLTLWYTAILFLILMTFSVVVYIGLTRSLFTALDDHLQREVSEILGNLHFDNEAGDDDDHEAGDGSSIELAYQPDERVFWRVLDSKGRSLIDNGSFEDAEFEADVTQTNKTQFEYATLANNTPIRLHTVPFVIEHQGAGVLQVAESYQYIQEVQGQLIFLLAIGIPFTLLGASVGGWFLATNALNPIDRITRTVQQISADDLHHRLNLKLPNDEVGRLAATFDQMLARLEAAFERQKRFIADASHEMRTPLTILKGDIEVALNRPRTIPEYQHTLEMVNQTTDRLNALVQELFLLARADNHQFPFEPEQFNLADLLTKEVANLMPYAIKKDIALNLDTPENIPIKADPAKLSRLFMNLIDNALKYSDSGGRVDVSVTRHNDHVCTAISDTGPGIPLEHLPQLFDRFYRVDKARSRSVSGASSSGAGLGLSIAQWLAQVHGGYIEVESTENQGSTFMVWLPIEPATI